MASIMNIAKITSKGQITLPTEVRSILGVHAGDKILFISNDDGSVTIRNTNLEALRKARQGFAGAAQEANLKMEDDVNSLIKSIRADRA